MTLAQTERREAVKTARALEGKTIRKVRLRASFDPRRECWIFDPEITFTDGSRLRFVTQETEGDYGTSLVLDPRPE